MSRDGVQEIRKHGGAQLGTHESQTKTEFILAGPYNESQSINDPAVRIQRGEKIQDGASKFDDSVKNPELPANLQFLAEEMDNYDRAVVENNAEWLKSRCRNIDSVAFNITTHPSSEVALIGEKKGLSDSGVGDLIAMDTDQVIPLSSVCSDSSVLSQDNVLLLRQNSAVTSVSSLTGSVCLENVQTVSLDSSQLTMLPTTGPELNLDKEMFTSDSKELEFQSIMNDKSTFALMTPQELEAMPEGGMEFEESVGPKSNVRISLKDGVLSVLSDGKDEDLDTSAILEGIKVGMGPECLDEGSTLLGAPAGSDAPSDAVYLNVPEPAPAAAPGGVVNASQERTLLQQGNLTLATISISTDKAANSTQILVDTNQGQQVYQINTADLTLASNALADNSQGQQVYQVNTAPSPVKPPTQSEVAVLEPADVTSEPATPGVQQQGSPVKSVTGYLLLPVARPDGANTGMLMTLPATAVGATDVHVNPVNSQPKETLLMQVAGKDAVNIKSKKMFLCPEPGCGKVFKKLSKLQVHHMRHTGERPFKCSKHGCDWAFTTHYKLKRHEESHQGRKDYECSFCDKKFSTIYNLNSHVKLHDRPCNETCPVPTCGEKFPTKRQLDLHMKNHEGMEKTYKCPVEGCDKVFYSANCMGSHPRVHQQDLKELTCDFEGCGRVFDKHCRLKQHKRSHTGEKPYLCHFEGCGWAFTTASKLKRHMAKHTGVRKWVCKMCGKAFMRAEHLKGHMITHSGMKPFNCPFEGCKAKFSAKSSLYVHLKKHDHSGEDIIYHCPMEGCEKKYSSKASLRAHILKHFPGCLTPEDAAQLDIAPLFSNEELESSGVDEATTEQEVPVSTQDAEPQGETTANPQNLGIDPAEFITSIVDDPVVGGSVKVSGTQSLTVSGVHQEPASSAVKLEQGVVLVSKQPKVIIKKEGDGTGTGSARTDYHSNLILKNRARKLRKLQKKSSESGGNPDTSSEESSAEKPGVMVMPATSEYSSTDAVSSRGITFRDPETGVLYLQTQLLQDDPPHPDLYADEAILCSELSLPESSTSEITDHGMTATEFVGSTINLQDLV